VTSKNDTAVKGFNHSIKNPHQNKIDSFNLLTAVTPLGVKLFRILNAITNIENILLSG
jgi:hypothetical protein